eukprot:991700_1
MQSNYWNAFASTAYLIHDKSTKFTPNKSKHFLQKTVKSESNSSINEMSELLLLMIDESILIYSQSTSFNHINSDAIIDYCWLFLLKRDPTIHNHVRQLLSKNKSLSKKHKHLALILYCQIRALFRKNSVIFQFKKDDLPKYICQRISWLCQKADRQNTVI